MGNGELEQLFFQFSPTCAKRQHLGTEYICLTDQNVNTTVGTNLPIYIWWDKTYEKLHAVRKYENKF